MKIAYIIPSLSQVGPVILLQNLIKGLLCDNHNADISVFYFDNICEVQLPCTTKQINFNTPINFDEYDIIHTHCFRADRYVIKWRKKINRAKIVTTIHQDTYESFRYDYPPIIAYLLTRYWLYLQKKFDLITAISHQIENRYSKYLCGKSMTIHNGVNVEKGIINSNIISQINNFKLKYRLMGSYAKIVERKGLDQLIDILHELKDVGLVIMGDGPYKKTLQQLIEKRGLQQQILFLPSTAYPYLYLENIDIYCMPSYSEGFGLAMVEAALVGKAIVCSDLPSFHEIFSPDEACFFELRNKQSLLNAINKAFQEKEFLGEKCLKRAKTDFTYSVMAKNYYSAYERLLK